MTRRDITVKILAYGITLLLLAVVNYDVLPLAPLPIPLLMPLCAVAGGCLEGAQFGAGLGAAAGIFQTALGHGGWGDVALLCIVGWLCGLLGQYVLRQDLWGHIICCVVLVGLWEAIQLLTLWGEGAAPLRVLLPLAGGEALCTLVWAFPVYGLHRFCCLHYGRIYHE